MSRDVWPCWSRGQWAGATGGVIAVRNAARKVAFPLSPESLGGSQGWAPGHVRRPHKGPLQGARVGEEEEVL